MDKRKIDGEGLTLKIRGDGSESTVQYDKLGGSHGRDWQSPVRCRAQLSLRRAAWLPNRVRTAPVHQQLQAIDQDRAVGVTNCKAAKPNWPSDCKASRQHASARLQKTGPIYDGYNMGQLTTAWYPVRSNRPSTTSPAVSLPQPAINQQKPKSRHHNRLANELA